MDNKFHLHNDTIRTIESVFSDIKNARSFSQKLFDLTFDSIHWTQCANYITRANTIAKQLSNKNPCFEHVATYINNKITELSGTDALSLLLRLIDLQIENNNGTFSEYINIVEKIIDNKIDSIESDYILEHVFKVREKLLNKNKQSNKIGEHYRMVANFYENRTDKSNALNNSNNLYNVLNDYEKAIKIYRQCRCGERAEIIQRKIEPIKKQIVENMSVISSQPIDITPIVQEIKASLEKCNFKDALIQLILATKIFKKDEIKDQVISQNFSLDFLFSSDIFDKDGRKIITIPPLDLEDIENNPKVLEMYMHKEMVLRELIHGGIVLENYLKYINENMSYSIDDLDFLIKDNFIIPQNRKEIIKHGMYIGLTGDYYMALHILVPQIENIFVVFYAKLENAN